MNNCIFIGRFTRDPELLTVKTGETGRETNVVNFTLAVTRKFKKRDGELNKQVEYLLFEAWDSGADVIVRHFRKDDPIIVYASARNNQFETSKGDKISQVVFRVERFEFPSNSGLGVGTRPEDD